VVPEDEYEVFRETMDSDIKSIASDESLVCYFEDGSFSVVPKTALVPFCPDHEPYVSYAKKVKRFFNDAAIIKATAYWNSGEIPSTFKWLALIEFGYCEKEVVGGGLRTATAGSRAISRKRANSLAMSNADDDIDDDPIDPTSIDATKRKAKPTAKGSSTPSGPQKMARSVGRPKKASNGTPSAAPFDDGKPTKRKASIDHSANAVVPVKYNEVPAPSFNPTGTQPGQLFSFC
jgi:hypothetical protein